MPLQNKSRYMRKKVLLISILVLGIALSISIWLSSNYLTVTEYSVEMEIEENIRIVHLTDLHSKEFGEDNKELVEKVTELSPDLIFMTGDMFNKDQEPSVVCKLIEQLEGIAPVYYGYGNDEMDWELGTSEQLEQLLTEAGARVLNCEYVDIEAKGQKLRIGGYYGYYRTPHMRARDKKLQAEEIAFGDEFEDTDNIKILLSHIPTTWLDWERRSEYPVDLIFSGHYHGGQVRFPFVGGLYAPYVGWFPKYSKGMFEGEQGTCILSAGLGSGLTVPRINNLPEIVVVDLVPQK